MELQERIERCHQWILDGSVTDEMLREAEDVAAAARSHHDQEVRARAVMMDAGMRFVAGRDALATARDAVEAARGLQRPIEVETLILLARVIQHRSLPEALSNIDQAMSVCKTMGVAPLPILLLRAGEIYGNAARYHEALALLRRAEYAFELQNNARGRLSVLNRMTTLLGTIGDYGAAIEYGFEALEIAEAEDHVYLTSLLKKNLAYCLSRVGRFGEAFTMARAAISLAQQTGSSMQVADGHGTLGDILLTVGDHAGALAEFTLAYEIYTQRNSPKGEGLSLSAIARTYAASGDDAQARNIFVQALELLRDGGQSTLVVSTTIDYVNLLVRAGEIDAAEVALDGATADLQPEDMPAAVFDARAAIAAARGDAEQASRLTRRAAILHRRGAAVDTTSAAAPAIVDARPPLPSFVSTTRTAVATPVYATPPDEVTKTPVQVRTFGVFDVVVNGRSVRPDQWKRKKARDVFKYLIARYRTAVTSDEIVMALWGEDVSLEDCLPTLQNATSAIRLALEPDLRPRQASSYLQYRDGAYVLDLGADAHIDLEVFRSTIHAARVADDAADRIRLLRAATDVAKGDLFPDDRFEPWTAPIRDAMKHLCIEALTELAELSFERKDTQGAMEAARRVLEMDDTYEDVYEILLEHFSKDGRTSDVERIYEQCRKAFQREYGSEPPAWLRSYVANTPVMEPMSRR